MKYNINDRVRFKITEHGWQKLSDFDKSYLRYCTSIEGYTITSFWQMMQSFGPHMLMGGPLVIETSVELLKD